MVVGAGLRFAHVTHLPEEGPISPSFRCRDCDALLFWRVYNQVLGTIERGAERQR